MKSYTKLMEEALQENREWIDCLQAYQEIITTTNYLAEEYQEEDGIGSIYPLYPTHAGDYFLITLYLTEKGKIMKDIGSFIDELITKTGLEYDGDIYVDADSQTKTWTLIHRGICYTHNGIMNPKVKVKVDASKSQTCKRVPTGEMVPVYEFICEEE